MNLRELYDKVPVEQHKNIKVIGDRVFVKDADGSMSEYVDNGEELWLVRSDKELEQRLAQIEAKLSISK